MDSEKIRKSYSRSPTRFFSTVNTKSESFSFTKDHWIFLILFFFSSMLLEAIIALPAPLYPFEAETKGLSPSLYGAAMGANGFAMILATILGVYIDRIGLRTIFIACSVLAGLSTALFGLLHHVNSYGLFLSLSFLLRAGVGIASIGVECSVYQMLFTVFPGRFGTAISVAETGYLMGGMLGPFIGTAIFSSLGYAWTFISFGIVEIGMAILAYWTLPPVPEHDIIDIPLLEALKGYREMLKIPSVTLFVIGAFLAEMGKDFVATILEPALREHKLSSIGVGLTFFAFGAFNILAPFWGMLLDNISRAELIVATSFLLICTSVALLGPLPALPISRTYTLVLCALLLFGFAQGMLNVSTLVNFQLEVEDKSGRSQEESASPSFVPIILITSAGLGGTIGATAAGVLFEHFGFSRALLFVFTTHLIMGTLILSYMACRKCRPRTIMGSNSQETQPIVTIK